MTKVKATRPVVASLEGFAWLQGRGNESWCSNWREEVNYEAALVLQCCWVAERLTDRTYGCVCWRRGDGFRSRDESWRRDRIIHYLRWQYGYQYGYQWVLTCRRHAMTTLASLRFEQRRRLFRSVGPPLDRRDMEVGPGGAQQAFAAPVNWIG